MHNKYWCSATKSLAWIKNEQSYVLKHQSPNQYLIKKSSKWEITLENNILYIYTHWASRVLVFQFSANVFPLLGCLFSLSQPPWWTNHSITLHPTFLNYCIAALETKFQVAMCSVEPTLAGELVVVDGGCMCTRTGPHWWAPRSDPHRWGPSVEYNGRTTHLVGPTASVYLHVDGEIQMKQC